jgi:hypothetical protein
MIFPSNQIQLEERVLWLVDKCMQTREDRARLYDWREKYYLFGTAGFQPAKYNRIRAHLDLVSSFLYAPDNAFYHIAAVRNADDDTVAKAIALQDDFNDDFTDTFQSVAISEALDWSLTYDTMIIKQGWNRARGSPFIEIVPPHNFGVYREDRKMEDQSAFCHQYFVEYQYAVEAMIRAGRRDDLDRLSVKHEPSISPFPQMLQRMIIANTGGTNLAGNVLGQVNPDYSPLATYQPKTEPPGILFSELWAWDDMAEDYRCFHVVDDMMVGDSKKTLDTLRRQSKNKEVWGFLAANEDFKPSETNYFIPQDHPFTVIQPYPKYNYFWGVAHLDQLVLLQEWMLERLDQIADILERQAYPATSYSGASSLSEEKAAAFGGADTWVLDQMPGFKVEKHAPDMPADIFHEFDRLDAMFLEASGLTDLVSGKGEKGVRSGSHAQQLKKTGSGRIKKTAERLKPSLVRIGDVGLKLKIMHDNSVIIDENKKSFKAAEIKGEIKMRVDGHEYSPLFSDEAESKAVLMKKMGVIRNDMFVRLIKPPAIDNVLHDVRKKAAEEAAAAKEAMAHGIVPGGGGRRVAKKG